jgi:hypothetical protein
VLDDFLLAPVAADAGQGHSGDPHLEERFLHGVKAFGSNDTGDELHGVIRWRKDALRARRDAH